MKIFTVPNFLSLLRLPLAAAFLAADTTTVRGLIVAAAALSDFVDGQLARRLGWRSRFGEILDPITDKIFVLTALIAFLIEGRLLPWELFLLVLRDLANALGFFVALARRIPLHHFQSRWGGKVTTTLQLVSLLVLLFVPAWSRPVILATGAAALYAVADYAWALRRSLRGPAKQF